MKKTLFLSILCGASFSNDLKAQSAYAQDALTFSQQNISGTARMQAIGGTQVSLGGDIGAFGINPAGLGFYRTSDISISGMLGMQNAKSSYINQSAKDGKDKITIPSIGVVLAFPFKGALNSSFNNQWQGGALGVNHTRVNDYNTRYTYKGYNTTSSMTQYFADAGNGLLDAGSDFIDLANQTYLITSVDNNGQSSFVGAGESGNVNQHKYGSIKGGSNETNISWAANYGNRLFIGLGLGIVNFRRDMLNSYQESGIDDPNYAALPDGADLTGFQLMESVYSRGSGINAKLGLIVRATEELRIGIAMHTPTYFRVNESYSYSITSQANDKGSRRSKELENRNVYNLRTPFRLSGGASFFFNKNGFLSADIDYVDYAGMRISSGYPQYDLPINDEIRTIYKNTINFRVGGEYRIKDITGRLGYAFNGNPYTSAAGVKGERQFYTAGIGLRSNQVYIDLAGIYDIGKFSDSPYSTAAKAVPVADMTSDRLNFLFTIGTRF